MDLEELAMMLDSMDGDSVNEKEFNETAEKVKNCNFEDDQKLVLYGLYKQGTMGNINIDKPYMFDYVGTAKWNSWKSFEGFPKKSAMGVYIYIVSQWLEEFERINSAGNGKSKSLDNFEKVGSTGSTLLRQHSEAEKWSESEKIFDAVVENNIEKLTSCINDGANVNLKSAEGLTPLLYASDRGHLEVVQFLLANNADVSIQDQDGQTALDYAKLCEHADVIRFLETYIENQDSCR